MVLMTWRWIFLPLMIIPLTACQPYPTATPAATCAPTATVQPTAIVQPTAMPEPTATPAITRQIDERFPAMGITINIRPTARYKLIAAFAWRFGDVETAPTWARRWLVMPEAGADHNVFGIVAGSIEPVTFRLWWPDDQTLRQAVGWVNIPIYAKYWPPNAGPYNWRVDGGDEMLGLGLYQGDHWSFAGVWIDSMKE